ncbi:MAG: EAL domain-containing protein [Huintestinicola sp.]
MIMLMNPTQNDTASVSSLKDKIEQTKYAMIADQVNCGIWEYDISTGALDQSRKLDGKWADTNLMIPDYRKTIRGWGIIYPDDIPVFEAYCDSMDNGDEYYSYDLRAYTDHDRYMWLRYIGRAVTDENGKAVCSVGITLDIDKEMRSKELERHADNSDALTGCLTLPAAEKEIKKYLEQSPDGAMNMLVIIDIDNFKYVNDAWGHVYGDYILELCAEKLKKTFTSDHIIGRIGGDEFIAFKKNIRSRTEIAAIAQNISETMHEILLRDGKRISVSIGASVYPRHGKSFEELYKHADIALYRAKRSGKNRFNIFNHTVGHSIGSEGGSGETEMKKFNASPSVPSLKNSHLNSSISARLVDFALALLSDENNADNVVSDILAETGKYFELFNIVLFEKRTRSAQPVIREMWRKGGKGRSDHSKIVGLTEAYWNAFELPYNDKPYYILNDFDKLSSETGIEGFKDIGSYIGSCIQCAYYDGSRIDGYISFNRAKKTDWTEEEINSLSVITKIISSHIQKNSAKEEFENELTYTKAILGNQALTAICIDPSDYSVFYYTKDSDADSAKMNEPCYKALFGYSKPCTVCPVKMLTPDKDSVSVELYSTEDDAWYSYTATRMDDIGGRQRCIVCRTDVSGFIDRVRARDGLTGLLTLDKFETEAMKKLAEVPRNKYCIVYTGFKRFNSINDEWGYSVGDEVLRKFAAYISATMFDDELFARISGDNFLMMLNYDNHDRLISRLDVAFHGMCVSLDKEYPNISSYLSSGIYVIGDDDFSIVNCIDYANIARKSLKNAFFNGNEFAVFDSEMSGRLSREKAIEQSMLEALTNKEFKVFYQPKHSIKENRIGGAEALCRWQKSDGTMISPGEFIPVFENNGFIAELDFYVYRTVCADLREMLDSGIEPPLISVNVSRAHLKDPKFADKFCELVDRYEIPHKYIELELTETMFLENLDKMLGVIGSLRLRGFEISIDDFGSGYSSLNLIKTLPVDSLKIDSGFFKKNVLMQKDKAVISAIFSLAAALDLHTIAEGIETEEQVKFVTECSCDMIQGYYYYKPMDFDSFRKLITDSQ